MYRSHPWSNGGRPSHAESEMRCHVQLVQRSGVSIGSETSLALHAGQ